MMIKTKNKFDYISGIKTKKYNGTCKKKTHSKGVN